jgi:hypothetical protein
LLIEHRWKLSEKDAALSANYHPLQRPTGKMGTVDIGTQGEVLTRVLKETPVTDFVGTLHQHVLPLGATVDWTQEALIA